jgi:hypothetical protein
MAQAAFWGFVGGVALVIGALLTLVLPLSSRVVGLIMAFGAGVLISASRMSSSPRDFWQPAAVVQLPWVSPAGRSRSSLATSSSLDMELGTAPRRRSATVS